ncbi:centrosomal protein 224-like [Acanthochromis polyacanthus]|uniref:centrosomal protein 224-like n=1 Tax=Acanthochromis polyacanthus TaxID=80966 RepID=UPI0022346540|nr:centrosomal protein 224-like [Acanthochromis polyacanthus]
MWLFLMTVVLLDLSQATPLPGERSDLQFLLQDQVYLTISTTPAPPPQKRSSFSSSSSSSASSESSQSSEGPQQLRERQNLENTVTTQHSCEKFH